MPERPRRAAPRRRRSPPRRSRRFLERRRAGCDAAGSCTREIVARDPAAGAAGRAGPHQRPARTSSAAAASRRSGRAPATCSQCSSRSSASRPATAIELGRARRGRRARRAAARRWRVEACLWPATRTAASRELVRRPHGGRPRHERSTRSPTRPVCASASGTATACGVDHDPPVITAAGDDALRTGDGDLGAPELLDRGRAARRERCRHLRRRQRAARAALAPRPGPLPRLKPREHVRRAGDLGRPRRERVEVRLVQLLGLPRCGADQIPDDEHGQVAAKASRAVELIALLTLTPVRTSASAPRPSSTASRSLRKSALGRLWRASMSVPARADAAGRPRPRAPSRRSAPPRRCPRGVPRPAGRRAAGSC